MPSPAAHMMSGLLIAAIPASLGRKISYKYFIFAALVSVSPDLDMLLVFAGIDYFWAHRTFSHSIITVIVINALLWRITSFFNQKKIIALE